MAKRFKILVCGGRKYNNQSRVWNTLDEIVREFKAINILLIHGGANGADSLAGGWARAREVVTYIYPAQWAKYQNRAGPIRNEEMLDETDPHIVVAFQGGSGTAHMVNLAKSRNYNVRQVEKW